MAEGERPNDGGDPLFISYHQILPVNAGVSLAISSIAAITLLPALPLSWIGGWWLVHFSYAGFLLAGWWRVRRRPPGAALPPALREARNQRRQHRAVISALIGGSLWGCAALFLDTLDPARQTFLLTVCAGMVSGAATTLASMPRAAAAYVLATVLPFVVAFMLRGEATYYALGAMAVVFALAMIASSRIIYDMIARNRRLRDDNQALFERTRAAHAALLDVAESSEAFVFIDADRKVTQWNRKFADLLKLDASRLYGGASLDEVLAAAGLPPAKVQAAIVTPNTSHPLPVATGRWVRPLERSTPQGDTALLLLDVTEQYAANEVLARQNRRLEELVAEVSQARDTAERASRAKSSFLANMSHELRTPLNAVIGFSDIVRQKLYGEQSPRYDEYVADIHSSATHLLGIIDDILDLARVEANRIGLNESDIDLAETAAVCARLAASAPAAEGKQVLTDLPASLPRLRGDARLFRQVLLNLLGNAVKFSGPTGSVRIGANVSEAGGLNIWVEDDGIGIAPSDHARIFAPFEQAEAARSRQYGGVGLGLALVRAYVEAHQGSVVLHSDVGHGTRVTLQFPPERTMQRDNQAALLD